MKDGLKLMVLGAGPHGRGFHMPALARYRRMKPGRIASVLVCDLNPGRAVSAARAHGFEETASDLDAVLDDWRPDAAMVLTPVRATLPVSRQVIEAGIAALVEKPPGATVAEAEELFALSLRAAAPVMVSMNRRFDPVLQSAMNRMEGRTPAYLRVTFARENRTEDNFLTGTALHGIDALRMLGGDIVEESLRWRVATFRFVSGAVGCFEILPACGANAERYEISGNGFHGVAKTCFYDDGELRWTESGSRPELEIHRAPRPAWELDGTMAETVEFIDAVVAENRAPRPSPADVIQSVHIAHRLSETPEFI